MKKTRYIIWWKKKPYHQCKASSPQEALVKSGMRADMIDHPDVMIEPGSSYSGPELDALTAYIHDRTSENHANFCLAVYEAERRRRVKSAAKRVERRLAAAQENIKNEKLISDIIGPSGWREVLALRKKLAAQKEQP